VPGGPIESRGSTRTDDPVAPARRLDEQMSCAESAIRSYYGLGFEYTDRIVAGLVTTPERIRGQIASFGALGADEVMLYCWSSDIEQIDRLADVVA
jgi:hypothetical protein